MTMRSLTSALLAATLSLSACSDAGDGSATESAADSAAVARVTAGLRPGIVIKGAPAVTYSLAERMTHYKVPGVSIAVINGNDARIAWARGFGVKASGMSDSVTPTTRFQAASISKPVAATGLLHLVREGKLALDTPVNEYLQSWMVPDNAFTASEKVTLRRIVSHNAGLTVHGFPGYAITDSLPTVQQILDGVPPANTKAVRVDTTPGSIWRYSGGGFTVAQLAMTEVTGESFPALMRRTVLVPFGMTNSGYELLLPPESEGQAAAGHQGDGKMVEGGWHHYPEMAAAGLWTTPTDLLKWAREISWARVGKSKDVLNRELATEMLTVQKEPSGLGPMLHGSGRALYFEHGGANEGYRAHVMYFPELEKGAAVMTNSDAGGALAQEILFSLAAEYEWPGFAPREITTVPMDAAALDAYTGVYVTGAPMPAKVTVSRDGDRLFLEEPQYIARTEVVSLGGDKVISTEAGLEASFARDASGKVDRLMIAGLTLKKSN